MAPLSPPATGSEAPPSSSGFLPPEARHLLANVLMSNPHSETFVVAIVEDDSEDQRILREAIRVAEFPHKVQFFFSGREFHEKLNDELRLSPRIFPDLILLDLNLQGEDGRHILEALKTSDTTRSIPVVIYSTSRNLADINQCYRSGANAYINKPNRFNEIVDLMRAMDSFWFHRVEFPEKRVARA